MLNTAAKNSVMRQLSYTKKQTKKKEKENSSKGHLVFYNENSEERTKEKQTKWIKVRCENLTIDELFEIDTVQFDGIVFFF